MAHEEQVGPCPPPPAHAQCHQELAGRCAAVLDADGRHADLCAHGVVMQRRCRTCGATVHSQQRAGVQLRECLSSEGQSGRACKSAYDASSGLPCQERRGREVRE